MDASPKTKARRILDPVIDFTKYWGYFDGACQGTPGKCGVGVLLYLTMSELFAWKYMEQGKEPIIELRHMLCGCF